MTELVLITPPSTFRSALVTVCESGHSPGSSGRSAISILVCLKDKTCIAVICFQSVSRFECRGGSWCFEDYEYDDPTRWYLQSHHRPSKASILSKSPQRSNLAFFSDFFQSKRPTFTLTIFSFSPTSRTSYNFPTNFLVVSCLSETCLKLIMP